MGVVLGGSVWLMALTANAEKADFKKADQLVAAQRCADAEREYAKAVTLPPAPTDEDKWARTSGLRGLARIPGCFAMREAESACAALTRFHKALGSGAIDEETQKSLAPMETICRAQRQPFVLSPRPKSAPPASEGSTLIPVLASASGTLFVAGALVYGRSATLDEPTGRRSADFFAGSQSAFEGAGGVLMLAGGLLGAATLAIWYFGGAPDEAPAAQLNLSPTGLAVGGSF